MAGIVDVETRKQNFLKEITERQPNIQIVGEYINSYTPIKCYCPKHDYYWDSTPHNLMDGKTCKLCGVEKCSKSRTKSHEQFVQELASANPNIEVLGTYVKGSEKIEIRCKKHDYVYKAVPNNLLKGIGCKYCGREGTINSHIISHNKLVERIKSKHPDLIVITNDITHSDSVECYCNIHNYSFNTTRNSLMQGHGCSKCGRESVSSAIKLTQEEFIEEVSKSSPDVDIIGEYKGRHSSVRVRCKKCGVEWEPMAASLRKGCECPACRKETNYGRAIKGVNDITTTHPHLLQYFKNKEDAYTHCAKSKFRATLICPVCGEEKTSTLINLVENGFMCPMCDEGVSRPNKILHIVLSKLPVDYYEFEYSPDWAGRYSYDGYFIYQGQSYIIEMDGGFHYKSGIGGYYDEIELVETQRRDKKKDRLAKEHDIIMIRIDCRDIKINSIMKRLRSSILGEMFNLDNIDINISFITDENLLKKICDVFNNSERQSASYVGEVLKIDRKKVSQYLKRGTELGLCNYAHTKSCKNKPVKLTDVKSGEIFYFDSHLSAVNTIRGMGVKVDRNTFNKYLDTNIEYKGFICETVSKQERSG